MKKALSKPIAILLALCLMLSMLPLSAFATEAEVYEEYSIREDAVVQKVAVENEEQTSHDDGDIVEQELGKGVIRVKRSTGMLMEVEGVLGAAIIPTSVGGIEITSIFTEVTVNEYNQTLVKTAFDLSPEITFLTLPGTIKSIPPYAFYGSRDLLELTISQGTESIGQYALMNSRLETINIPASVQTVDPEFTDSPSLTVKIDPKNENILMDGGILYTANRRTVICAPEQIVLNANLEFHSRTRTVGERAFKGRKYLASVKFSDGVRAIEKEAFANCDALASVQIYDGVTRIDERAFENCTALSMLLIPSTVTQYGAYMFAGCTKLENLQLPTTWVNIPEGMYMNTPIKAVPNEEKVKSLGAYAFYGNKGITSFEVPETLLSIGAHAFDGCSTLTSVKLQRTMHLDEYAFANTNIAGTLTIPERITFAPNGNQFAGCKFLEEVSIGKFIPTLGQDTFKDCSSLQKATIPEYTETINESFSTGIANNFTIYGYLGTDAHRYAVMNIIPFVSLGNGPMRLEDIENHWGKEDMEWAYYKGLFGGTTKYNFSPDVEMTRAMFVAVMQRLAQEKAEEEAEFSDVKSDAYYKTAVDWAVENRVIEGTTETTFSPASNISRQQLCTILYRYAIYRGYDVDVFDEEWEDNEAGNPIGLDKYVDGGDVAEYAKDAMTWATYKGIIMGNEDGTIDPKGDAKRVHVTAIIHRFDTKYAGTERP